jgi:hypothetical protein
MPGGWNLNPYRTAVIDLSRVQDLGASSRAAIARWLAANGLSYQGRGPITELSVANDDGYNGYGINDSLRVSGHGAAE